jgi:hypothetical protein
MSTLAAVIGGKAEVTRTSPNRNGLFTSLQVWAAESPFQPYQGDHLSR